VINAWKPAAALVAVSALALAGAALAVNPKPNGLYIGHISGTEKRVQLHVSSNGKTATAAVYCSRALVGSLPRFPIVNGRFKAQKTTGSILVFALAGHFVSTTQAAASLNLHALCDGKGGTLILKIGGS
jgi:hypothetical protein